MRLGMVLIAVGLAITVAASSYCAIGYPELTQSQALRVFGPAWSAAVLLALGGAWLMSRKAR